MKVSKTARHGAKGLFRSCLANGMLDETRVREAVQRVLQIKPRGYLAILSQFQRLIKFELERRTARVESAVALASDQQASVQASLERHYGAGLDIRFVQNPALIGGMRIRIGSDVYDGSVQARLKALQESF